MAFFNKSSNPRLYLADTTGTDKGFSALLLSVVPEQPLDGYDIAQALTDGELHGNFILSAYTPELKTPEQINVFTDKLLLLLGEPRCIIWLKDVDSFSATENTIIQAIRRDGSATQGGLIFPLMESLILLQVQSGMQLTATDNGIRLGSENGLARIQFTGPSAPDPNISSTNQGFLPLTGAYRGCLSFSLYIERSSLAAGFSWGFHVLMPFADNTPRRTLAAYFPLADGTKPSINDLIGFNINIDPTDIYNLAFDYTDEIDAGFTKQYQSRRTVFDFSGTDRLGNEVWLRSYYFTTLGENIWLIPQTGNSITFPARLVFNPGETTSVSAQKCHLAPEGDFMILKDDATIKSFQLQCGLQGTEFFDVKSRLGDIPGDSLRYIANQPAYAPVFPLPQSSPVTAPVQPDMPLLNTQYRTSWCTVVHTAGGNDPLLYVAQPKGAALFGQTDEKDGNNKKLLPEGLMGHATPGFTFTANEHILFPMMPYSAIKPGTKDSGSFSSEQIESFENLILSPLRKKNINKILIPAQKKARLALEQKNMLTADDEKKVTTPSGLIAGLSGEGNNPSWLNLYLAQNGVKGAFTNMYFNKPGEELVQAFQTSDQFLVIANNDYLGTAAQTDKPIAGPAFYNEMFIGEWKMRADTGSRNKYNDYNNIIIVKGRKGKLYDPADPDNSLVANWQKWTDKDAFASPSTLDEQGKLLDADPAQLVILSQWMQTYFENAHNHADTQYFGNFNAIARDENWTGILVLGMNISGLPPNLNGILSGVRYPAAFRAHHFGIHITPVENAGKGPVLNSPSSMFGLIYYNDPDFIQQENPKPVAPDLTATYDFTLLNLKVLFENTAVKSFQSYAQLTTNNYFGSPVDHMGAGGNTFNTMILKGALQFKGDEAIYSLGTGGVNTFYFNSPVVNKVEVTNANFSTIGTNDKKELVSWFSINGFWDFKKLDTTANGAETSTDFDLFSFGSESGKDELRKGLIFNGLGIKMVSPPYTPGQTEALPKTMTFDTSVMTFDQARSTPRPDSIYVNFALNLQSLVQGSTDTTPQGKDYLTVITDLKVTPIDGTPWLGLSYQLNMGTPGALAGNIGLTATLLTAWDPTAADEEGKAPAVLVGVKLPGTGGGAKLISLQSVLKLSIGQIRLSFAPGQNNKSSFLMIFTEIALKFLGLLKIPPNGSTLFYLFGNPQSDGKASGLGWYAMYKKDEPKASVV